MAAFTDEEGVSEKTVEQAVYWFFHDYSEVFTEESVQGMVDPDLDFFTRIIMEKYLNDLTYLYRYGAYITKDELGIASYLNQMEESKIQAMADTRKATALDLSLAEKIFPSRIRCAWNIRSDLNAWCARRSAISRRWI